jgi:hypothetical protein
MSFLVRRLLGLGVQTNHSCSYDPADPDATQWTAYLYKNGGTTTTVRRHFESDHLAEWTAEVIKHRLKGWEALHALAGASHPEAVPRPREPFSIDGLILCLLRWIAVDDQVRLAIVYITSL